MMMVVVMIMMAVPVVMMVFVTMFMFMSVFVSADFHIAAAESAATFFAHIIQAPRRRFPFPVRVATRRLDCGNGGIR